VHSTGLFDDVQVVSRGPRPHLRPIKVTSLIMISLLSLAPWVAISEAVISLAVAVLS
jgi:hypothetical protein